MFRVGLAIAVGTVFLLSGATQKASAQGGLGRQDRLLIYYYSYYAQQNTQRILEQQKKFQKEFDRTLAQPPRMRESYDPIDAFVRNRGETERDKIVLPPIYSGGNNYFQRAPYFNPNQQRTMQRR